MGVIAGYLVSAANPSTVGGLGTTAKYFSSNPVAPAWMSGATGVNSAVDSRQLGSVPSSTSAAGQLVFPGESRLDGAIATIAVAGTVGSDTGDPSGTVNIELVANTGTVASPTYTVIASTGAVAPTYAGVEQFFLRATVMGSTASGLLVGSYLAMLANVVVNSTPKALNATLSGRDFSADVPFGLLVRATFGTTDATNTASLTQFQIVAE